MSTPVVIKNGGPFGGGRTAVVDEDNHLGIAQYPPKLHLDGKPSKFRFFAEYLGSTGGLANFTSAANADMAATTGTYFVAASTDYDIRITHIAIVFADTAVAHNAFGNVSALSTGFDLKIIESGSTTFLISKAKTGGQLIAQAGLLNGYGDGVLSWELSNWASNEDAQAITIPVGAMVPGGIRIGRGTLDRIEASVNDDLSGLTEMFVRVMGYRHYN